MEKDVTRLEWAAANALLHAAKHVLIVTHVHPDGDAIGSLVGLGLALHEHGKQVTMVVDGGVPREFMFIKGTNEVRATLENPSADLVISVDASDLPRIGINGEIAFAMRTPTIVVDHHATNTFFGTAHIVKSGYVSTTEAILEWLDQLGWEFSVDVARALMMGIITDTISFRVGPVSAETFGKAQRLMDYGVDIRSITERTLSRTPTGMLQLMGRGFERAVLQDHVIWTSLALQDFHDFGFSTQQRPELSSEMLTDESAYISAFFLQSEEGDVRVSFRCKPGFDVGQVAFKLGGGGHTMASGCTLFNTSLAEAEAQVVPLLKAEAARGTPIYK